MKRLLCAAWTLSVAACGSDEAKKNDAAVHMDAPKTVDGKTIDAARLIDAKPADAPIDAPQHVFSVTCPSGTIPTVTTGNMVYLPAKTTITVGGIVQFTTAPTHDVAPDATNSDPGLAVGFDQTACLQFMATGTFGFHCSFHGFTGSIEVQ